MSQQLQCRIEPMKLTICPHFQMLSKIGTWELWLLSGLQALLVGSLQRTSSVFTITHFCEEVIWRSSRRPHQFGCWNTTKQTPNFEPEHTKNPKTRKWTLTHYADKFFLSTVDVNRSVRLLQRSLQKKQCVRSSPVALLWGLCNYDVWKLHI